jgi:hypothetical protein
MTATTAPTRTGWQLPRLHGLPWVTWRQHRFALAGTVVVLGGFGILMLISGLAMHSDYASLGLNTCGKLSDPACDTPLGIFQANYQNWAQQLPQFLTFLPGLLGVFVGAPVVARELESGTFRFAWTQGRNRVQWIMTKLVLLGVTLTVLALAFSALFTWWYGPFGTLLGRMGGGGAYEVTGIVFAARTLFGFMLGALLGTLIRRTVPAMAATAAGWLAVTWPSVVYLRPLIQTPITAPDAPKGFPRSAWVINSWVQDGAGHHLNPGRVFDQARATGVDSPDGFTAWMSQHGYTNWISYQPESRFWHFQIVEASAYVTLALLLGGATIWWLHRRAT